MNFCVSNMGFKASQDLLSECQFLLCSNFVWPSSDNTCTPRSHPSSTSPKYTTRKQKIYIKNVTVHSQDPFLCHPHSVVVDQDILLVFGTGDSLLQPFQHGAVTGVLHVVLRLSQQELPRRSVQVLLTPVLKSHTTAETQLEYEKSSRCLRLDCRFTWDF